MGVYRGIQDSPLVRSQKLARDRFIEAYELEMIGSVPVWMAIYWISDGAACQVSWETHETDSPEAFRNSIVVQRNFTWHMRLKWFTTG